MLKNERTLSWTGLEELRPALFKQTRRRCRNEAEAEDIIQETLLRAARYRPALDDPARLKAWVLRIAANVHRDLMRREWRYVSSESNDELLHSLESSDAGEETCGFVGESGALGELKVEMHEALYHLPKAFQELPSADREVLQIFYRGNGNCLDLAQRFEISRGLAKVRVFRARKRLTSALRRRIGLHRRGTSEVSV